MLKDKNTITKIIKSGNFTVITWSRNCYSFYEGHQTINTVNDLDLEPFLEMGNSMGYIPEAMILLAEILGGKAGSI